MKKRWLFVALALIASLMLSGIAFAESGAVYAPEFTITEPSANRGDLIEANVSEVEGAVRNYCLAVFDGENHERWRSHSAFAGQMFISTAGLEPGSYTVKACAVFIDSGEGELSEGQTITVSDYAGGEGAIAFRVSKTNLAVNDLYVASAYAPGAEYIQIYSSEAVNSDCGGEGEFFNANFRILSPMTETYAVAVYADGSTLTSETITVTSSVQGEIGDVDLSLIDGSFVPAGQDLTVYYTAAANQNVDADVILGWSLIERTPDGRDEYLVDDESLTPPSASAAEGSFVIPGDKLEANHTYIVELYAYTNTAGYPAKFVDKRIITVQENGQDISLTLNGENEITVQSHEDVELTIHAPGATAIHLYKGRANDWDYWGNEQGFDEDIQYSWNHWAGETLALYLDVCFDPDFDNENAKWFRSAPLIVHVTADEGRLEAPQISVPSSVEIGSLLDIEVTWLDEHAEWCWADIYAVNENGEPDWDNVSHGDINNGHIYLPTAMLQPGQKYAVHSRCSAHNWTDSRAAMGWFIAAGEANDSMQFTVSNLVVATGEEFSAVAYVPNADALRIYRDGNRDDEWAYRDGNHMSANFRAERSGDLFLTLAARFQDDWQDIETQKIDVFAPNGFIDVSTVEFPYQHPAGQELTLDFSSTVADNWDVDIWAENSEGWNWHLYGQHEEIIVPSLEEGIYHCAVNLFAPGYEMTHVEWVMAVTGDGQDDISLEAPDNVLCAQDFNISLYAPGATAVSYWIPNWNQRMYQGERNEEEIIEQIRWPDTIVIYARACYDPIDWDTFDWEDWENRLNWGPISAVHTIEVKAPYGTANEPEVTGLPENGIVQWNEDLSITVSGAEHATWYDVRIRDRSNWDEVRFEHLDGPGTAVFSTYDLSPGDYAVEVYVAGEMGYAETSVQQDFILQGIDVCGSSNPELAVTSLPVGQLLEITVPEAENAEWYHARIRDNDWNEYCFRDLGGPGTYMLPTNNLNVGDEYFVIISTGAPGYYWNENNWEQAVRFTVTENEWGLWLEKTEVLFNEPDMVSVYAPGAERIRFSFTYKDENDFWDGDGWPVDNWQNELVWSWLANETVVRAEGFYNGEWQLIGQQTVNVTANYIYNDVYLRAQVPPIVDLSGDAPQGLVIPFPEGVTDAWANVFDDSCGGAHVYWMNTHDDLYQLHDVDNPDMVDNNYWEDHHGPVTEIRIPAAFLKEGHVYRIDLGMYGGIGVAGGDVGNVKFTCTHLTDDEITVTVNGSAEAQEMLVNEDWRVRVSAPGASAIRFFDGFNWHERRVDENGVWEDTWNCGDNETITVCAQACYDPIDWDNFDEGNHDNWLGLNWRGASNQIQITLRAEGRINAATFTLNKEQVARGEQLILTVSGMEEGAQYHANAYWREENGHENWMGDQWYEVSGDTISLPTAYLGEGEWIIRLDSYGKVGLLGNSYDYPVTVVEGESILQVSKTEVLTNERIVCSVYAPGAERIRFSGHYNSEEEPYWWDENGWECDSWQIDDCRWEYPEEGIIIRAEGMYDGEWQLIGEETVNVTANYIYNDVYLRAQVPPIVDLSGDAPQGLVIPFPEGVTDAWANVFDDSCGGAHVYWMNTHDDLYQLHDVDNPDMTDDNYWEDHHGPVTEIRIPAEFLKEGHVYHIDIGMHGGIGVDGGDVKNVRFSCTHFTDDEITVTVNGSTEAQEMLVNEDWRIRVSAPGASAIRYFDGFNWHERRVDENGVWEDWWSCGDDETITVCAQACYDPIDWDNFDEGNHDNWLGLNWRGASNQIQLTLRAEGRINAATFTLNKEQVPRGEQLILTVSGMEEGAQYHANAYWREKNGHENWMGDRWYEVSGDTISLPTADMGEGEWIIRLDSFGKVGLLGNSFDYPVTVVEGESILQLSKTDVLTNERIVCSVYAPGAERIRFSGHYNSEEEPYWWDENGWECDSWQNNDCCWPHQEEGITIRAEGMYNGEWQLIGEETVNVTALVRYDFDAIVPKIIPVGEDLEIDLSAAWNTWVNVWDESDWGREVYWMNWDRSQQSNYDYFDTETNTWASIGLNDSLHSDNGNFFLPAQYLKANHTYRMDIHVRGDDIGFDATESWGIRFTVIDGTDGNIQLKVNGASDEYTSVGVNEFYRVTATANGADCIRVFDGYNWHESFSDTFDENWRNGGNEIRTIYAQARYNDGDWEGVSNVIHVSSYSDQYLEVYFSIANENATVAMGDDLTLNIDLIPGAEYHAHIGWKNENGEDEWTDTEAYDVYENGRMYVPTDALWEGDFFVRLDAYGIEGYCDNGRDEFFTVTRGQPYFRVDKTEVETMECIRVAVYDPDATHIRFNDGYGWWDEQGREGCSRIYEPSWDYCPVENLVIKAEGLHGDNWVEIGRKTVNVTAPHGRIDPAHIETNLCQFIDDGLDFWVGMPEGCEVYDVEVWEYIDDEGGREWVLDYERYDWNRDFHVDAEKLQAGHTYVIFTRALGRGYEYRENTKVVAVVDPDSVATLTLPAALTEVEEEAFSGLTVQRVIINASGNVTIHPRAFADSSVIAVEIPQNVDFQPEGDIVVIIR